jgi:4-carboxymuconolactone decarboxylase
MTRARLDHDAAALIGLAAAIAEGRPEEIGERVAAVIGAGTSRAAVDELLLQSVLTVGWPRALVAAGIWRSEIGVAAENIVDDLDYAQHDDWTRRGEVACRTIYGAHYDRLRENVRRLHPALEAWMVTEGYGRTLSRAGLDLRLRELCTVAQTVVLRTPRQLHSHLLGALRSGASADEIEATMRIVRPLVSQAAWNEASDLWRRVRESQGSA